jgi:ParB family chromosome partitioning protein
MTKTAKPGAFAGLGDMLAEGFDSMLTSDMSERMVALDQIQIEAQDREEFEDSDGMQSLAELGKNLRKFQVQAILLRPNREGAEKPYLLVAGERRYRAARIEGLRELRAVIKPLTDAEAADVQFAENVHRKNLTQLEEAKRIQRDLDQLGSVEAVLAKHNKTKSWLSKVLSLLNLPAQAKRLVTENISADLQVINTVKTIEKADPAKAEQVVAELKSSRGKVNARELTETVRAQVKPAKRTPNKSAKDPAAGVEQQSDIVAVLDAVVREISEGGGPSLVWESRSDAERALIEAWLLEHFNSSKTSDGASVALVMQGLRTGRFDGYGHRGAALSAFLGGLVGDAFDPVHILAGLQS